MEKKQTHELLGLIQADDWKEVESWLPDTQSADLVEVVRHVSAQQGHKLLHLLPPEQAAEVFANLYPDKQEELLEYFEDAEIRGLLASMSPDDRTELFASLPADVAERLYSQLSPEDLAETKKLLSYPEESVGRLMTPDFLAARPQWTVERTLQEIREKGRQSETVNNIYVLDEFRRLVGVVSLETIVLSNADKRLESLMITNVISLSPSDDREEAARKMQEYDISILPVVSAKGTMLGIVTIDDVLDVAEEETTEDFHKSAGVAPLATAYHEAGIWQLFRKRVGWLVILVFVNLASSGVIATFEDTLAAYIALAFFIPLLIDSGGNTGAQSATLMIRAIATGDVRLNDFAKSFTKEFFVGLTLGSVMALSSGVLGFFRGGMEIGIVVGVSMILIVLVANLIGTMLPFLLSRLRLDPAVASGPLITTVADVCGLLIYFSIARGILGI